MQVEIAHAIPGRIRLRSADLKGTPDRAEELRRRLADCTFVRELEINPATGSVLIWYAADRESELQATLQQTFANFNGHPPQQPDSPPNPDPTAAESTAAFLTSVLDQFKTMPSRFETGQLDYRTLVPVMLLGLGLMSLGKRVFVDKRLPFPEWYDFVWFAFAVFVALHSQAPGTPQAAETASPE